jgi:hypothetical protein
MNKIYLKSLTLISTWSGPASANYNIQIMINYLLLSTNNHIKKLWIKQQIEQPPRPF